MPNGVPMTWMASLYEHPPIVVEQGQRRDASPTSTATSTSTSTSPTRACSRATASRRSPERSPSGRRPGSQFLLPTEDAAEVAAELGAPLRPAVLAVHALGDPGQHRGDPRRPRRHRPQHGADVRRQVPRPRRRAARRARRRPASCPRARACRADATRHVRLVQYNDLEAVERELARGDVACVLAEAAITNTGVIQPADGFHAGLRRLTSRRGRAAGHRRDPHAGRRAREG